MAGASAGQSAPAGSSRIATVPDAGAQPAADEPPAEDVACPGQSGCGTVPIGHPSRWAACSWVKPSQKQSTTTDRYFSGRRWTSSWMTGPSAAWSSSFPAPAEGDRVRGEPDLAVLRLAAASRINRTGPRLAPRPR